MDAGVIAWERKITEESQRKSPHVVLHLSCTYSMSSYIPPITSQAPVALIYTIARQLNLTIRKTRHGSQVRTIHRHHYHQPATRLVFPLRYARHHVFYALSFSIPASRALGLKDSLALMTDFLLSVCRGVYLET